ncbi:MAG TPA: hypothetical protein PKY77_25085 [Phycisphaerae bacterium]|nr:hypothetical protein [Phycisphaerae bacterium]HRY68565.1 hypothetical protein [Phycisphaerae bacterium]HSA25614.1 hypothetical protein [Phycisphaerae bacterium]
MWSRNKIAGPWAALLLGLMVPAAFGQIVSTFDTAEEVPGSWSKVWGDASVLMDPLTFDAAADAAGSTTSGAMKIVYHFTDATANRRIAIARPTPFGDMLSVATLDMDIYVTSTSAKRSTGDHGYLTIGYFYGSVAQSQWMGQAATARSLGGGINGFNDDQWFHVSIPMASFKNYAGNPSSASNVQGVGFELLGRMAGDVTFWVDNIKFVPKEPPPPPATEPLIINKFNDPAEADQWVAGENMGGELVSKTVEGGEMKVVVNYAGAATDCDACAGDEHVDVCTNPEDPADRGCNNFWITKDFALSGTPPAGLDLRGYGSFEIDMRVDFGVQNEGTSAYVEFGPMYGPDLTWVRSGGTRMSGAGTYHVSMPMSNFSSLNLKDVRAWRIQFWGNDPRWDTVARVTGPVTIWIDNIVLATPPIAPQGFHVWSEFDTADGIADWCPTGGDTCNATANAVPSHVEWDGTVDHADNPASGSMKVTVTWDKNLTRDQNRVTFQRDVSTGSPLGIDLRDYNWIIARVKFDPASPKTTYGAHAQGGVVFRNMGTSWEYVPGWTNFLSSGVGVNDRGWHVVDAFLPSSSVPARDQLTQVLLDFMVDDATSYTNGDWSGTATFWIDHIMVGRPQTCQDPNNCEICNNLLDENGDQLIDCEDPDCQGVASCPVETDCTDFMDDDGDGLADCADPDCGQDPSCKANVPFADVDGDGDVDQQDFGFFQACFSGPFERYRIGCGFLDRNHNFAVDAEDFWEFQGCFSGPSIKATQASNPDCEGLTQ